MLCVQAVPPELASLPRLARLHVQFNKLDELPVELARATTLTALGVGGNLWRHDAGARTHTHGGGTRAAGGSGGATRARTHAALACACEKDVLPIAPFPMHVTPRDIYDAHYTPRPFSPPPQDGGGDAGTAAGGAAFASALLASLAPGRRGTAARGLEDDGGGDTEQPAEAPLGRYVTRAYTSTVLRGRALAAYMAVLAARAPLLSLGDPGGPGGGVPSPRPGSVSSGGASGPDAGSPRGGGLLLPSTAEDPARIAERRLTAAARRMGSRYLDLSKLELRSLPVLPRLPSLTDLDVSANGLAALPPTLYELRSLKRLVVRHNELVTLDAPWGASAAAHTRPPPFPSLVVLDASDNRLARLPEWLGACAGLSMLIVSANPLRALPPCLLECVALTHFIARATRLPPAAQGGGIGVDAAARAVAAGVANGFGVA